MSRKLNNWLKVKLLASRSFELLHGAKGQRGKGHELVSSPLCPSGLFAPRPFQFCFFPCFPWLLLLFTYVDIVLRFRRCGFSGALRAG